MHNIKYPIQFGYEDYLVICSSFILFLGHLVFQECQVLFFQSMAQSLRSIGARLFKVSSENFLDFFIKSSYLSWT